MSLDTNLVMAQHNSWNYLLDSPGAWVIGIADDDAKVEAGREFKGSGFIRLQQRPARLPASGRAVGANHR